MQGLLGSPGGQGLFLAVSALFPGRAERAGNSYLRIYRLNLKGEKMNWASPPFKYEAPLTAAAFGPGCKHVIAYTGDESGNKGVAVIWNLQSGQSLVLKGKGKSGDAHDEAITHVAFTRDGKHLVTTSRDDRAFVWDPHDGFCQELLNQPAKDIGHTGDIEFASFDRAGTRVVTAGADGAAVVWECEHDQGKYRMIQKIKTGRALTHALFSTDERYVVTADQDGKIALWDGSDGRELGTKHHLGQILWLGCREGPDGDPRVYALANGARSVSAYSMQADQPPSGWSGSTSGRPPVRSPLVMEWRLSRQKVPDDEKSFVQWVANREVTYQDDRIQLAPVAQDLLFNAWKKNHTGRDRTQILSRGVKCRWHECEAARCELVGRWDAAVEHWTEAIKADSGGNRQPILYARRARAYSEQARAYSEQEKQEKQQEKQEKWQNAEKDYSQALEGLAPERDRWRVTEITRERADTRKQISGKRETAISDYLQLLKSSPDDLLARYHLADAYLESQLFEQAVNQYNEAVKRDAHNPVLLERRAKALGKLANPAYKLEYDDYLAAARLFRELQQLEEAVGAYHAAVRLFKNGVESSPRIQAKVYAELAALQAIRGLSQESVKNFQRATEKDETDWTYWSGLAHGHQRLRNLKEAGAAFDEAIKRRPNDIPLSRDRAEVLFQLRDFEKAATAYQAIIDLEPKVLSYRIRLAAIYLQPSSPGTKVRPEQLERARGCLAKAAADFPKDSSVWQHLATVQLAAGKIDEYKATRAQILKVFKTATGTDANNVAWTAVLAPDAPEGSAQAIKLAEKAVSFSPRSANYLNPYGAALFRAGKREDAIEQLEKATNQRARAYLIPEQKAYGDALDLVFMAMAQYTLDQAAKAQEALQSAIDTVERVKPAQQSESPNISLARVWQRLEFEILVREAKSLINP
jgi:tetratricopeptide (TPR) repeat protein